LSHTASGSSFKSLYDLCQGLERLDKLHGFPYGEAAPSSKTTSSGKSSPVIPSSLKGATSVGFVAQVQDTDPDATPLEMHKDAWVGAVNLLEEKAKLLRSMFKCVQCHSDDHTLPHCPLMKNWILK